MVFCIPAALFWLVILYTYLQAQVQPEPGISQQDKAAIPCNEAHRPVATCAHRGNAAELLTSAGEPASAADSLQQMHLLWQAGVMCFDMDVIQLRGGEMVVGHPADLAARVDAAALLANNNSSSSRGAEQPPHITADQLHAYSLQELRTAGLSEQAAPTLQSLLRHFKQLLDAHAAKHTSTDSKVVSVQEAVQQRSWIHTPLISLEPKGPAAVDAQAFLQVSQLAAAAGVSGHTVLWLRQMPPAVQAAAAATAASSVVVSQLAAAVKQGMAGTSSSSTNAGQTGGQAAHPTQRPLLGLIVADMLLQQEPQLAALQKAGEARKLAAALLATAGGVASSSGNIEEGAAAVLDAFDVLAPSIKLPPKVLWSFLDSAPCLAWTLEDAGHTRRALWLGMDVAITNTPMAQLAVVEKEQGTICNK